MKGYIPIEIPTKKYIRAFIIAQLGPKPLMSSEHVIGSVLINVLQRTCNERRTGRPNKLYDVTLRLYITMHTFRQRGVNLNESNLRNFNSFVQALIKDKMRFLLDLYVPMFGSFEKALVRVREVMQIEDEDWDSDSIKKDYYRYRLKNNMPLLYNKAEKVLPHLSF